MDRGLWSFVDEIGALSKASIESDAISNDDTNGRTGVDIHQRMKDAVVRYTNQINTTGLPWNYLSELPKANLVVGFGRICLRMSFVQSLCKRILDDDHLCNSIVMLSYLSYYPCVLVYLAHKV